MNENSRKRAAWAVTLVVVLIIVVVGACWYKSSRPRPVARAPLAVVGVGLFLGRNAQTRQFEIHRVFPNSPADKAGITPGLVLNKVDGVLAQTKNIKDLSKLLTGPVGSKVTLELVDTNGQSIQLVLIREQFLNRSKPSQ